MAPQQKLCVFVRSRDGRYFAKGYYFPLGATGPEPLVEYRSDYSKELGGYSNRDIAVSAFKSATCNEQEEPEFVVTKLTPMTDAKQLVIHIRAGEARVRAQVKRKGKPITREILCEPFHDASTVGFTGECSVKLPVGLKSGNYQLSIGETTSSGEIQYKIYALFLWFET
jgi:hypothetical protein